MFTLWKISVRYYYVSHTNQFVSLPECGIVRHISFLLWNKFNLHSFPFTIHPVSFHFKFLEGNDEPQTGWWSDTKIKWKCIGCISRFKRKPVWDTHARIKGILNLSSPCWNHTRISHKSHTMTIFLLQDARLYLFLILHFKSWSSLDDPVVWSCRRIDEVITLTRFC